MSPPPPAAIEVEAVTDTTAVTIPDPFTAPLKTNELYGRRRKTEKSQWGVAAPVNTANFQHQKHDLKPMAKRWDRKSSPVRGRRKMLLLSQMRRVAAVVIAIAAAVTVLEIPRILQT